MQLRWILCVLTDPHKTGGGRSCLVPLGCIKAKPLWSGTQSDHRYSTTHFTGKPVGIILNCRLCSAFPRALCNWVSGYLSFQRDQLFARSWGLVDGAVVPEDTASGSLLCMHGVGWEEQDSSFGTFLYKYSLSKALSHTYLPPSGSVFWSPHRSGPG